MMRLDNWRYFDFLLFAAVLVLSIFGIAMINSAVAGNELLANYVPRQTIFVGLGLVVIFIAAAVDYHYWMSFTRPMYVVTVILLIIIFIFEKASFGSARWLKTGLVDIQPSELAKIVMVLVLAEFFAKSRNKPHNLRWVGTSLIPVGTVVVWILLQPNLSTSIVIFVIWFSMIWISGLPIKYLAGFIVGGVVLVVVVFPFLAGYQQQRILDFFVPDPSARYGNTYNVDQALITIGSGGWYGMGYGRGTQVQLRFLKVRHTDFIFSALSEEFGFIGAAVVLLLIGFVIWRCLRIARRSEDPFGALIAYGFAIVMFFQTIVNVGVNLNVIPVTGLTLPFISYGGSSVVSMLLGIGLVQSVALHPKTLQF
jgi:rod shape determining protein RodA